MTEGNPGSGRTALITGASQGIGAAFARRFAEGGYDLVIVARSEDRLESVAKDIRAQQAVTVDVIAKDLAKPEAPEEVYETVQRKGIQVHTLVNNAGIAGTYGRFHETDLETELSMMQLNMRTPVHLTKLFGREMVEASTGAILNVASTAAFNPGPMMAVYHGTKSFLLIFSEAIAEELRDGGVTVTVICPGRTNTGFLEHSGIDEPSENTEQAMDPDQVATAGFDAVQDGKTLVFPNRKDQLTTTVAQVMPRSLVRKLAMKRELDRGRET